MAKEFEQDALVWAKMKGFPPWPARIDAPSDGKTPKSKKPQHYVFFFGTHDFAWILDQHIFPHSDELLANSKQYKKKSSSMQAAIQEIENEAGQLKSLAKQKENKDTASAPPPSPPPSSLPSLPDITPVLPKSKKKYYRKKKIQVEKKPAKKRSAPSTSTEDVDIEEVDIEEEVPVNENAVDSDEDYSLLVANVPPNNGYPNVAVIPPYSDASKPDASSNSFTSIPAEGERLESTSGLYSSHHIRKDFLQPTTKRIGFLGLGVMGKLLVKKLLCTRHSVTIWNRSKLGVYPELVELGAKTARNPKDVIRECDIIFCCVLDAEASKSLVFGRHGVLDGFNEKSGDKGYIEMSTIDAATSEEIAEAITGKGGRYLEAPMIGSRQDVVLNSLVILAAGDKELFTECCEIFASFSKHALYINCEVGLASKYTACLNLFWGTCCTALAETLAVVEKCKVNAAFFMDLISSGPANFKLLLDRGQAMLTNDQTVTIPVKNQKRAMTAALKVGDTSKQPLNLATAANVAFAHLMQNDQESDISAIFKCYK